MLRRDLPQMLASLPLLRHLWPSRVPCKVPPVAWSFVPMLSSEYRLTSNGRFCPVACTLYVEVRTDPVSLRAFAHAYYDTRGVVHALCDANGGLYGPVACCVAEAERIGFTLIDITAHKEAFLHACERCAVPMQAIEGVIASFTLVERHKAT